MLLLTSNDVRIFEYTSNVVIFTKASIPVKSVIPRLVADIVPVKACASATEISESEFVLIAVLFNK